MGPKPDFYDRMSENWKLDCYAPDGMGIKGYMGEL